MTRNHMRATMPFTAMQTNLRPFRHAPFRIRMSCFLPFLLLAAGAPFARAVLPHHHQPRPVVRTIERLEQKFQDAQVQSNLPVMSSMLADDFLGISPDGTLLTKAEMLDAYKNGAIHITSLDTLDQKVRVYGSTAVVLTKVRVAGVINGEEMGGHYRYTRVYHYDGTTWKIVSFEASKISTNTHKH
ncbi:MAG: nuclear transport factor 2 family protein [Acidobacteriaceae bacterium]